MLDAQPEIASAQLKAAEVTSSSEINYLLDLITTIENLYNDGLLNKGNANALISKIKNAIKSIEKGNTNAATGQIGAFTNEVEDFVENGVIPEDIGESLISEAEIVINQVNGMTYVPDDNFEQALIDLGADTPPS